MTKRKAFPMFENFQRGFCALAATSVLVIGSGACRSTPAEPESHSVLKPTPTETAAATTTLAAATPAPTPAPTPPSQAPQVPVSDDDPLHGKFTLDDATASLAGKGALVAEIETDEGKLSCDLYDDKAPITVANFVGLARGLRPFKGPDGKWSKMPAYDGTTFHRVVKGFMIQGGDPNSINPSPTSHPGAGEPGYVIPDEIWPGALHDQRGLLCMANRGPNTNGQQFFITDAAAKHLDGKYTIFGKCGPDAVIEKLASVPTQGDQSVKPSKIKKVTIKHKGK